SIPTVSSKTPDLTLRCTRTDTVQSISALRFCTMEEFQGQVARRRYAKPPPLANQRRNIFLLVLPIPAVSSMRFHRVRRSRSIRISPGKLPGTFALLSGFIYEI
ncbi:MAG: hypothetical protein SOI04_07480, partial [Bifidobacterium thermacidophilum]|uniref:hypothetical protein n=1 Tax=Bifidobacterium thermacidophilum TaxID=246618 RepID=UPI002F3505DB